MEDFGIPLETCISLNGRVKSTACQIYLVHNVLERIGAVDGKADKKQIGFWVGKWSKTVVFFLAGSIPEG